MSACVDSRAPTTTFLTHYFGGGLIDQGECYVVERFRAMSKAPLKNNGRGRPKPEVASVDAVQELVSMAIENCTVAALRSPSRELLHDNNSGPLSCSPQTVSHLHPNPSFRR